MLFFIESVFPPSSKELLQKVRKAWVRNKLPASHCSESTVCINFYILPPIFQRNDFFLYLPLYPSKRQIKEMSQKWLSRIVFPFVTLDFVTYKKSVDKAFGQVAGEYENTWALRNWTQKGDLLCMYVLIRVLFWDTLKILDLMQNPRGSSEQE